MILSDNGKDVLLLTKGRKNKNGRYFITNLVPQYPKVRRIRIQEENHDGSEFYHCKHTTECFTLANREGQ